MDPKDLRFRKADENDAPFLAELRQDPEVAKNLHCPRKFSTKDCEKWLANMGANTERLIIYRGDVKQLNTSPYGIYINPICFEDKNVGVIRIDNIDLDNRNCYVGLDIQKTYRGKGLARPIYSYLFGHLFTERNFETLYLEYVAPNDFLENLYRKLGFVYTGYFQNKVKRGNLFFDSILMSLSSKDWYNRL